MNRPTSTFAIRPTRRQVLSSSLGLAIGGAALLPFAQPARGWAAQASETTLRVASYYRPASLAPQLGGHQFMQANVYLPPFFPDADGALQPGVCNEWSVSEDGITYTLKIDPAARFSDGSPVTADDIKFSWDEFCRPDNAFPNHAYVLQPVMGYGEAVSGDADGLAGVEVVDPATVRVTVTEPNAAFIKMISTYLAGITKREEHAAGEPRISETPIGAGPYRLRTWDRDSNRVVWEPSPNWWGPTPLIGSVDYQFVEDANTQALLYENDEIDVFRPNPAIVTQMQLAGSNELSQAPYSGTWVFCFKANRAPMDDVNVRRALVKAVDMDPIAEAVFQGTLPATHGLWPRFSVGYEARPSQYDPDAARAALAASAFGGPDGVPPITLAINPARPEFVRVAEAMQQMWQDVLGLSVEILPTREPSDIAQIVFDGQACLHDDPGVFANDFGLSQGVFLANIVEASATGLDEEIRAANQMPVADEAARIAAYREVETALLDLAFYIPVTPLFIYYAVKSRVAGFAANSSLTIYTLPQMQIDA